MFCLTALHIASLLNRITLLASLGKVFMSRRSTCLAASWVSELFVSWSTCWSWWRNNSKPEWGLKVTYLKVGWLAVVGPVLDILPLVKNEQFFLSYVVMSHTPQVSHRQRFWWGWVLKNRWWWWAGLPRQLWYKVLKQWCLIKNKFLIAAMIHNLEAANHFNYSDINDYITLWQYENDCDKKNANS